MIITPRDDWQCTVQPLARGVISYNTFSCRTSKYKNLAVVLRRGIRLVLLSEFRGAGTGASDATF